MTCYFSASSLTSSDLPNSLLYQCARTTLHASSGETPSSERAKHIDIRKHFAHEVIQNGEMRLVLVPTPSQLADILTKGLDYLQWQACVEGILSKKANSTKGTPQEGMDSQGLQVEWVCSHDLES